MFQKPSPATTVNPPHRRSQGQADHAARSAAHLCLAPTDDRHPTQRRPATPRPQAHRDHVESLRTCVAGPATGCCATARFTALRAVTCEIRWTTGGPIPKFVLIFPWFLCGGAEGGTRNATALRPQAPETARIRDGT